MSQLGTISYMRAPFIAQLLGVDTPWMSIDTADVLDIDDETFSQINKEADPTSYVTMLSGASDDVEEVGHDEVRGEEATHYKATVNLGRLAEQELAKLPPELRDKVGTDGVSVTQFGAIGDMLRSSLQAARPPGEDLDGIGDIGMNMTMEMYDYGVDVNVEAPPADWVTDVTDKLDEPVS